MPWYRYGNPNCPKYRDQGHPAYSYDMLRAYIRDPVKRVFTAVGWYCQSCHYFMSDEEAERRRKEERSRVY